MSTIKERIDDYLGFDSSKLFVNNLVRVFGGAVRDCIAGMPINDIDVMVGANARFLVMAVLKSEGYEVTDYLCGRDLTAMYLGTKAVCEPTTMVKGHSVVQLIRPSGSLVSATHSNASSSEKLALYEKAFHFMLSNVDITCCGVSWDGITLYENVPGAVSHCLTKTFDINKSGAMYQVDRIHHRTHKLLSRGWMQLSPAKARDAKIEVLFSDDPALAFVPEHTSTTLTNHS